MPNEVNLSTFPETEYEALALLYVQNQDLSDATPEEIYNLYFDAKQKMKAQGRERRKNQRMTY